MKTTRTWAITKLHELTNISAYDYNCAQPFSVGKIDVLSEGKNKEVPWGL